MSDNDQLNEKDLQTRMDSLRSRLDSPERKKKQQDNADSAENKHRRAGVAQAFKLSSEFIAGIVVGAGIGYGVDVLFGTSPWGFIFFFLIGFAAAILNVLRSAGMVAESEMRLKPARDLQNKRQDGATDETDTK